MSGVITNVPTAFDSIKIRVRYGKNDLQLGNIFHIDEGKLLFLYYLLIDIRHKIGPIPKFIYKACTRQYENSTDEFENLAECIPASFHSTLFIYI